MATTMSHQQQAKRPRRLPILSPVPELVDLTDEDSNLTPPPLPPPTAQSSSSWTSARLVDPSPPRPSSSHSRARGGRPLACRVCHIRFSSLQQFAQHRQGLCRGFLPAVPSSSSSKMTELPAITVVREEALPRLRKRPPPCPGTPNATLPSFPPHRRHAQQVASHADPPLEQALAQLLQLPLPLHILSSVCAALGPGLKSNSSSSNLSTQGHDTRSTEKAGHSPSSEDLPAVQKKRKAMDSPPPLLSATSSETHAPEQGPWSPSSSSCDLSLCSAPCGPASPALSAHRSEGSEPTGSSQAVKESSARVLGLFEQVHLRMRMLKQKATRHQLSAQYPDIQQLERLIAELVQALQQHLSLQRNVACQMDEASSESAEAGDALSEGSGLWAPAINLKLSL